MNATRIWIPALVPLLAASTLMTSFSSTQASTNSAPLDITFGRAYPILTVSNMVYQLEGRDSPFTNQWDAIGDALDGTGEIEYGFERGDGPIWIPARRFSITPNTDGYSLAFDGSNDYAFTSHHSCLNLTNHMTLAAWVKPCALRASIIMAKAVSPSLICYSLGFNSLNQPLFNIYDATGSPFVAVTGNTALASGLWHHVSATWDGSQANVLVDGVVNGTTQSTGTERVSSASPFQIGSIFGASAFAGDIDQVQVWSIARSTLDIMASYQTVLEGDEPGLIAFWPFTVNEGQFASDKTTNNFVLTLGSDQTPDISDPAWTTESFVPSCEYDEVMSFGELCIVVGHYAETGSVYQLQSATNSAIGQWSNRGCAVTATSTRVDHLVLPTNHVELFRNLGPAVLDNPNNNLLNGLAAYYPFDGSANDASGTGNDGTVSNVAPTANRFGQVGCALYFNGSNANVTVKNSPSLDAAGQTSLSICAWVNLDALAYRPIVSKWGPGGRVDDQYYFGLNGSKLIFIVSNGVTTDNTLSASSDISTSSWTFVASVYDTATHKMFVYINGVESAERACSLAFKTYPWPVLIGGDFDGKLKGAIDDVRIYNRALSPSEVMQLYQLPY